MHAGVDQDIEMTFHAQKGHMVTNTVPAIYKFFRHEKTAKKSKSRINY
jgi:hypothetical protein